MTAVLQLHPYMLMYMFLCVATDTLRILWVIVLLEHSLGLHKSLWSWGWGTAAWHLGGAGYSKSTLHCTDVRAFSAEIFTSILLVYTELSVTTTSCSMICFSLLSFLLSSPSLPLTIALLNQSMSVLHRAGWQRMPFPEHWCVKRQLAKKESLCQCLSPA